MADERFDLIYTGQLAPGADPERARRRLTAIFKLSEKGADRLFNGKPVIVKRGVDAAAAAQVERVFANAGAVLNLVPTAAPGERDDGTDGPHRARSEIFAAPALALSTDWGPLEDPPAVPVPQLDLGYLSLTPGDSWTLEDCAPPPTPIPQLDLSYLTLDPPPAESDTESRLD